MRLRGKLIIAVALALVASVAFGFIYDFLMTASQRDLYRREYSSTVRKYAAEYGVDEALVYAVIKTESNFDPNAESSAGAMGLMQLTPETFLDVADRLLGEEISENDILDPEINIRCGVRYLAWLIETFESEKAAVAAYNAGPGRVSEWLEEDGELNSIPIGETRIYVSKVLHAKDIYERLYYS